MQELQQVMETIRHYLPEDKQTAITNSSKKFYAHYALRIGNGLWRTLRHKNGARAQIRAAWNMQKDILLFYKILKLYTRMTLNL